MNLLFKTAARNILRNSRRSLMTGSAVAAGAIAMLLFGGFVLYIFSGLETSNVQRVGHLSVFRNGYFLFGNGNPAATCGGPPLRGAPVATKIPPVPSIGAKPAGMSTMAGGRLPLRSAQ